MDILNSAIIALISLSGFVCAVAFAVEVARGNTEKSTNLGVAMIICMLLIDKL